jgi:hypothetical protein
MRFYEVEVEVEVDGGAELHKGLAESGEQVFFGG